MLRHLKSLILGLGLMALSCTEVTKAVNTTAQRVGVDVKPVNDLRAGSEEAAACKKLQVMPSIEEEYTLGGAVALNWVQKGGGLLDAAANGPLLRYLNTVGRNLGAQSSRPTLRWTFGVLQNDETVNALSTPGGYIFVTRKLLESVENEAQLAGVLAHEIAHVTERHVLNQYGQVKIQQCEKAAWIKAGKNAFSANAVPLAPGVVDSLVSLRNTFNGTLDLNTHVDLLGSFTEDLVGRLANQGLDNKDEYDADEEAVRLLVSAGYDPMEFVTFLSRIPDSRNVFAHHPKAVDRKKRLTAFIRENKDLSAFNSDVEGLARPELPPEIHSLKKTTAQNKP